MPDAKLKLCPICSYKGDFIKSRKEDNWHPHEELSCPDCRSAGRHRMIWLAYNKLKEKSGLSGKMLHCSPMKCLKEKFIKDFIYTSIDFPPRESEGGVTKAHLNQDLRDTFFRDNYFDAIVCVVVLDYIKEAEQAIQEIYRILKPRGIAFIVVPIFEDEKSRRVENTKLNRQWRCGLDFFQKYIDAGFEVKIIKNTRKKAREKYGLTKDYLALCHKPLC